MSEEQYLNFNLRIEETDDGYVTRVVESPAGEAVMPFTVPFSLDQWRRLLASLEAPQAPGSQAAKGVEETLRQWGERLFHALFQDHVLACYRASRHLAYQSRAHLRLLLDTNPVPHLASLPWEFLLDPVHDEFLAATPAMTFSRYTHLMHRVPPLQVEWPLRALVVIANPSSYPPVHVEREWLGLVDTLDYLAAEGRLILERLTRPTLFEFQRRLRQRRYQIVHFIGHSLFNEQTGEGHLVFEDEMGRSRLVSGQHLGALMRDHQDLRLVILQGSQGTYATGYGAFVHVAQSLVQRGMAAVLATQFEWPQEVALGFLEPFLSAVAGCRPVDEAVAAARMALGGDSTLAWGAPILWMRTPDGVLLSDGPLPAQPVPAELNQRVAFRLNSLRIRTATRETIARWASEPPG
ncbi:MAG: hypothetical protein KatS3mg050_1558 [Litorilinea sp.]|nr:MAG: hypothetical protein KatS3mg050_1558 [Litorilinea sp.]